MIANGSLSNREEFYSQGGVRLFIGGGSPLLVYESHDHEIRRSLKPKPKNGVGEFHENEVGLRAFYDVPWESWVIVHTQPHLKGESSQEWWTDTIFIPDQGDPYIKQGFSPVKPDGRIWSYPMALLLVGSLAVAIGFWVCAYFN